MKNESSKYFVDHVSLELKAGNGGAGSVSFRREKYAPKGGPDGGDGGRGGHVIFLTSSKLHSLIDLKTTTQKYTAKNGMHGSGKKKFGSHADDLIIEVPVGTLIYNQDNELIIDLNQKNQRYIIAQGGKGGKGNTHFSTSKNRTPRYAQAGLPGEEVNVHLELRLLAQVGLIGIPNAGKSSLLKGLTNANPKIRDYPFTTLFPNLGTIKTDDREVILADIPGLIKGASQGQGLGHQFLRHVDRTTLLIHLVPIDETPEKTFNHLQTILDELLLSNYDFSNKTIITVLSKCDLIDEDSLNEFIEYFSKKNIVTFGISTFTNKGISTLMNKILSMLD